MHIVCGTDLSARARAATLVAAQLARRASGTLTLVHAFDSAAGLDAFAPDEINVVSNSPSWSDLKVSQPGPSLQFVPNPGWKGHIEL